ncbi:TetR/AcrR family transcriptional regulator [Agaribacterium haliotis]|uniref:TetR/AcrR family transcriptional regulator n=1 Tax=Agaribacterium haliotis TaxID=2013869 RepID=UPI000BB597E0|nr:TetR/AcrR family transcriptional regulator [Agaribacterium haliotis]
MARPELTPEQAARREVELLDIAYDIVEQQGLAALTMDKVVKRCSYSKGTVYKIFSGKEDLLSALCIRGLDKQLHLYQSVADFSGSSREKALALVYAYQFYARHYPVLFRCVLDGLSSVVLEKTQAHRLAQRASKEQRIAAICDQVVAEALTLGDISSKDFTVAQLTFANWAMSFGTTALMMSAQRAYNVSRVQLESALLFNASLVLDGIVWRPLYKDYDYESAWLRIQQFFQSFKP